MKKILAGLAAATMIAGGADAKTLVAYYSRTGNTMNVANEIATATDADMFRIETSDANYYPAEYTATTQQAQREIRDGTLPPIKTIPDLSQYDVIFIGTPCWWGTMAPPVRTFLSDADLSGKTVIPFNTHGGSGVANVHADIADLTPNSKHLSGIAVYGSMSKTSGDTVQAWLKEIGIPSE